MRADLIRAITASKDVTHAIVLTHNIDFVFVQTMLESALRKCGHPTLTIFADAQCAAESYVHQRPVLDSLGVRYRVVPVEMSPGFRFHPKALLLSGPGSADLWVGSGNLTFGGWRENAEIWTRFSTGDDGTGPFHAFLLYLREIAERISLPEAVRREIDHAFDPSLHPWAVDMASPDRLVGKAGSGPALWDRIQEVLPPSPPDRATVVAPYFDADGEALRTIASGSNAPLVEVLVQSKHTTLSQSAVVGLPDAIRLHGVGFARETQSGGTRQVLIHAKCYGFQYGPQVVVFAGSANCSRAALTVPGHAGNAELMAVIRQSADEFDQTLSELERTGAPPELPAAPPEPDPAPDQPTSVRVLAAHFEDRDLLVACAVPDDWSVTACVEGDRRRPLTLDADGIGVVTLDWTPRSITVEAKSPGGPVLSAPMWVDREAELRTTGRGRGLVDSVRSKVRGDELAHVLHVTALSDDASAELDRCRLQWRDIVRRGAALRRLEAALEGRKPMALAAAITLDTLHPGDLLWQGASGYCVVTKGCSRQRDKYADVLTLQGDVGAKHLLTRSTVPLRGLLDPSCSPIDLAAADMGPKARAVLQDALAELGALLADKT